MSFQSHKKTLKTGFFSLLICFWYLNHESYDFTYNQTDLLVLDIRKRIIHDESNQIFTLSIEGLGTLVIGLQTTSFVLIVISTLSLMWSMCRYRKRDDNDHRMGSNDRVGCSCKCLSGCLICFYPIAGNLNEYQISSIFLYRKLCLQI